MSLVVVKNTNTMSSTQLAELLGKDKKEVNRQIREMFADKIEGGDSPPSITATLDARGYVVDYHLPELESNMFAAKYDASHLEKVCQFWIVRKNVHVQPAIPSHPEALRLAADAIEKNNILTIQIETDKPKVTYANAVLSANNPISIRDWVKTMQSDEGLIWGERKVFAWLDSKYTFKDKKGTRHFYAQYSALFSEEPIVVATPKGNRQYSQLKITGDGQITLGAKLMSHQDAECEVVA